MTNRYVPMFTIITVCYNSERCIDRTMKSVLKQKYRDYEYIVVDGNSTDSTVEIANKYIDKFDGRLKVISESDQGIYDAMNKGINLSCGEYVIFINSDDELAENVLNNIYDFINRLDNKETIIYGDSINIYRCHKEIDIQRYIKAPEIIDKSNSEIAKSMCGIRHQSMLVHRSIFDNIGVFDLDFHIYGDWDFFIRSLLADISYKYINKNISFYTMDGTSMNPDFSERHRVRIKNNLVNGIDIFYFKDIFSLHSILKYIFGMKRYNKLQYWVAKYRYSY
jgi:glycosyltransferase involved in cell wall biosynthesis